MTNIEYKIVYFKDGRYAIANNNDIIIDDAQGYGYKTKQKAILAANWKYKGGREKSNKQKDLYKAWIKENDINSKIIEKYNDELMINVKELCRGEITIKYIWGLLENDFNTKIPEYVKLYVNKMKN